MRNREITPAQQETGRKRGEDWLRYPEWGYPAVEWDDELGVPTAVRRGPNAQWCPGVTKSGEPCASRAGHGTLHSGVGYCRIHDTRVDQVAGAWVVAHMIARQLDVSPWEALLLTVKRAAAWSQFYEHKLACVEDDDSLRPGGVNHDWVVAYERVTDKLARYSKMAVDAGVAAMLVARARTEGETIARVLNQAIGAAGLTEDQEQALRTALRVALSEVERENVVEGELVSGLEEPRGEVS